MSASQILVRDGDMPSLPAKIFCLDKNFCESKVEFWFSSRKELLFAKRIGARYFCVAMSTLVEIQDAVGQLAGNERKALQLWLDSQSEPLLTAQEEQRLLRSLDEAARDIDAGKGVSAGDVRKRIGSWAAR